MSLNSAVISKLVQPGRHEIAGIQFRPHQCWLAQKQATSVQALAQDLHVTFGNSAKN